MAARKPVVIKDGKVTQIPAGDTLEGYSKTSDINAALDLKVDKVTGKQLSTNDYTTEEKNKLAGVASEATKNRADSLNADKLHTHTTAQVTGLGTAATKDVGLSTGQVMEVGAFGAGHTFTGGVFDANDIADQVGNKSGFYPHVSNIGSTNVPYVFVYIHQLFHEDSNLTQIAYGYNTPVVWVRHRYSGDWSPWVKQLSTGDILQTTGNSTEFPMSQAAVTDQLANTLRRDVANTSGFLALGGSNAVDGVDRTIEIATNSVLGGGVDNHTGVRLLSYMTGGWGTARFGVQFGIDFGVYGPVRDVLHTGNTTTDPDGTLKASSPVINLYTDKHDLHNDGQFGATPTVVRKSKGVYEITGTLGLRSEGWYLDTPSDRNGNKYFNIEWTQNITPDAVDGVVDEYRDDIVVTIETFERVWNKDTGMFDNGAPIDINDLQDRFVQLRFNELKVGHEEFDNETVTRNQE